MEDPNDLLQSPPSSQGTPVTYRRTPSVNSKGSTFQSQSTQIPFFGGDGGSYNTPVRNHPKQKHFVGTPRSISHPGPRYSHRSYAETSQANEGQDVMVGTQNTVNDSQIPTQGTQFSSQPPRAAGHWADGPNDVRRSVNRKCERGRRSWCDTEDRALIQALKDLVVRGWKSDNGFRSGYQKKLEKWLSTEFPNTDLKVNPHIISKITAWKKSYYSLASILERSGVGFNVNNDYRIDCDDDQWEQIVRLDNGAKAMRYKSWPYWYDWKFIFGKDRAVGGGGEWVKEVEQNVAQAGITGENNSPSGGYDVGVDDVVNEDNANGNTQPQPDEHSSSMLPDNQPTAKKVSRKRKGADEGEGLLKLLGRLQTETNSRLDTLSKRIGYDMDLGEARKDIFSHLEKLPDLSDPQRYDLCDLIGKQNSTLEIFMGLPDVKKPGYVRRLMEKEGI